MLEPAAIALFVHCIKACLLCQHRWEFPSVALDEGLPYTQRKALLDIQLQSLLGPGVHLQLSQGGGAASGSKGKAGQVTAFIGRRHDVDTYVHTFSHIRWANATM